MHEGITGKAKENEQIPKKIQNLNPLVKYFN